MSLPLPPARRHHRRGRVATAGAALAAGLTVAAVIIVITHRPPSRQAPGVAVPTVPPSTRRVPAATAGPSSPGIPVPTVRWRAIRLDGAPVPVSPAAGPFTRSTHLAWGFADTPAGAVLAAVGIAVRTSGQLGPAIFIPTITRQVTGNGSAALMAAARADYGQAAAVHPPARPGGPAGKATAAVRAFRLTSWTPAAATMQVVTIADGADGRGLVTALQVRWQNGDWRLAAPPGGNFAAVTSPAPSLAGFTLLPGR